MQRTGVLHLATALTVAALATALASPVGAGTDRGNKDGQLVIGHLGPESGDLSAIIDSLRTPITIAIDEINAAGGVNDQPVILVTGDDGGGPEPQTASHRSTGCSRPTRSTRSWDRRPHPHVEAIADKIDTNAAVVCTGSETSPELSRRRAMQAGTSSARRLPTSSRRPRRRAGPLGGAQPCGDPLAANDPYGRGYAKAMSKALKQGGAKVVANVSYDPDGSQFDADAEKVADVDADALALIAYPDTGSKVIQALIAAGVGPADVPLYTTDGLDSSSIPELVDPANLGVLDGVQGTTPAAAPAGVEHPFQGDVRRDRRRHGVLVLLLRLHHPHGTGRSEGEVGRSCEVPAAVHEEPQGLRGLQLLRRVQGAARGW